jgi:poly-beta-1,6-N-acetyl-D-glucosamine synthase
MIIEICLALIVYTYFGYPLILSFLTLFHSKKDKRSSVLPSVTLLMSAYNEEGVIEKKIKNSLALDYPKNKLQIIVVSDGSSDKTDAIVKKYRSKGIILNRVEGRGGKNVAINKSMRLVKGEIVVFCDANSMYEKDALKELVAGFANEAVGCVSGELRYLDAKTGVGKGEGLYWKYEQFLKKQESKLGHLLSANGAIFAVRKKLFEKLNPKVANDFQTPQDVASQGYKVVYAPRAVAFEKTASSAKEEFNRKTRIIARGFEGSFILFDKFTGLRFFEWFSHKFLRWLVWIFLILMFVTNIFLIDIFVFRWLFYLQVLFYFIALLGPLLSKTKLPLVSVPYYFCMVNLAAMIGFFKFITRKQKASWEPPKSTRRGNQ